MHFPGVKAMYKLPQFHDYLLKLEIAASRSCFNTPGIALYNTQPAQFHLSSRTFDPTSAISLEGFWSSESGTKTILKSCRHDQ